MIAEEWCSCMDDNQVGETSIGSEQTAGVALIFLETASWNLGAFVANPRFLGVSGAKVICAAVRLSRISRVLRTLADGIACVATGTKDFTSRDVKDVRPGA